MTSEKKLYLLSYDHGGYILWGTKVKDRLQNAFDWLEKYPGFRVGLDFESYAYDAFEKEDPSVNEMIRAALKKYPGRFGIGSSTYGQPLSMFLSEESNARQLIYAVRSNLRHFGCTPPVYSISEHALHNQIPQLAKLCGFRGAILRTHVMAYGYCGKTFGRPWGQWIGEDGSALPAVPTYPGEGGGFFETTLDNWILTRWPEKTRLSPEDFLERFGQYQPLLASRMDDLTLREEALPALAEKKPDWQFILLEDIPAVFGPADARFETSANDFHGRMPWGYCGNEIFGGIREAETAVSEAERLNAFSVLLGGEARQAELEEAWKNLLAAQHHDITICGLLGDARRLLSASRKASERVRAGSLAELARRFALPDCDSVLAVNLHSFPVREWIEIPAEGEEFVRAADGGVLGGTLCFEAEIPPLTAVRCRLERGQPRAADSRRFRWDAAAGILDSPQYRIRLTEAGIASVSDAESGEKIADNGAGALFRGWIDGSDCASRGVWTVRVSAFSAEAVQEGTVGSVPFRFTLRLRGGSPRIDCSVRFELNGQRIGHAGLDCGLGEKQAPVMNGFVQEEKLRFVMKLCLDPDRRMVRDLPYSIAEWDGELVRPSSFWYEGQLNPADRPAGEDKDAATYLQGNYWACLRDGRRGAAFFNRGSACVTAQGNLVSIPLIYSDEYIWNTQILKGSFTQDFAVYPFRSTLTDLGLHQAALSYEYPAAAVRLGRGSGDLGDSFSFASQGIAGGAVLTAVYPENGAVLARFCNYSGEDASLSFRPCSGRVTAETDLLGNPLAQTDGNRVPLHKWEIKTLKIEPGVPRT